MSNVYFFTKQKRKISKSAIPSLDIDKNVFENEGTLAYRPKIIFQIISLNI